MKAIILGATGMVGQGVLRECLSDHRVSRVLCVGRSAVGVAHPKLDEILAPNLFDLSAVEGQLQQYDACFFCLGVSSFGMSERDYRRVTYDLTLYIANLLLRLNPRMTFIYVSGAGTDSSERGRVMWARVKGATENALLALPFRAAYMFRPGMIIPMGGITSKTLLYRIPYAIIRPLWLPLRAAFPRAITTTQLVGQAMINAALGEPRKVTVESAQINELGTAPAAALG